MELINFLGQSAQEVIDYCQQQQIPYQLLTTRDPYATNDRVIENRVIRLSWNKDTLLILLGCFTPATYHRVPEN